MFSCPERIKSLWLGLPGLRQHFHMTHTQRLFPRGWPVALSRGMAPFKNFLFYLFIFGCTGSWLFCGASSSCSKRGLSFLAVPGLGGFSCCRAQAPGTQASVVTAPGLSCGSAGPRMWVQKLWHMAIVALQHVGSSWARNRTRVPCISRRILIHCATREVLFFFFFCITGLVESQLPTME